MVDTIPEVLHYKFELGGSTAPNLASAPPPGTATATLMGAIQQNGMDLNLANNGFSLVGSGIGAGTDYLNTGWAPNLGTGSWTISMATSGISVNTTLYYVFGDTGTASFRCFTNGVAGPNNFILRGGGLTDVLAPGGALPTKTRTTFVYDSVANVVRAYVDGVLVNTVAQGTPNITGTGPFKVMGYSTNIGAPAGGLLDDFRVYSRALSAQEVVDLDTAVIADLSLTLTDSPDPVTAGTSLSYVATATNNGPAAAQDVTISLPLPAVTAFVSATPSAGGNCTTPAVGATGTVDCTWAGATANATARTATVVVDVPPSATGNLSATGTVTSSSTDPDPMNDSATADTAIAVSADLSITLTDAPDPVTAGSNLTYTATVTNGGPSDAQDVSISLPLPAGTNFVSATPSAGGSCNAASPVVCTFAGATAPAGVRSATIVAAVAPATTGVLSATATAATTTPDPVSGNDTATATTNVSVSADLSITLTDAPDPVTAGSNLVYTATVSNAGPSTATGVTVTMPVPANTTLVSGSSTGGGSCAGAPIVCTFPTSIAPTTSQTATITVAVSASAPNGSSISATATAGSTSTDPNGANNSASTTTAVVADANLQLTLSASSLEVLTNEPVTFTAVSLNLGPSDAQNLSITMTLTPDFRYSAHTATGATCTTPQVGTTGAITCTWAGATAPNASRTLQVVAFSNNQGATAVNASTVSDTSDPVTTNNVGNVSVQVGFAVEGIPTLNQYGLILLGLMLGLLGFVAVRRNS
ncbi:MAG: IPTL-CTERM sorting domain-containing protein [Lysobacterales bacterium]